MSVPARWLRLFQPSHQHTAFSATVLLMTAMVLSRVVGYLREAYTAWAFGAGPTTDAYIAAFQIPDFLAYLVAGGTISITFVSIYTRFLAEKREEDAQKTFSVIITVMTLVLGIGVLLAEIFAPQITRLMFHHFKPEQIDLCVHLTRILLPAQILFYVGGVVSAVLSSRRLFLFPALGPLIYNAFIILGGVALSHRFGIASLAYGALAGTFVGPFLINAIGAARVGTGYSVSFDVRNSAFREWVRMSIPLMIGVSLVSADDWILRYFASDSTGAISHINYAKRLLAVPIAILGQAVGQASLPFFARLFGEKTHAGVCGYCKRVGLPHLGCCASRHQFDDGLRPPADRLGIPPAARTFRILGLAGDCDLFLLVLAFARVLGGARTLCAGFLRSRKHAHPHGSEQSTHGGFDSNVPGTLPGLRVGRTRTGFRLGDCSQLPGHGDSATPKEAGCVG